MNDLKERVDFPSDWDYIYEDLIKGGLSFRDCSPFNGGMFTFHDEVYRVFREQV